MNRLAVIDSDNALDAQACWPDHDCMVRDDRRLSFTVSMLQVSDNPRPDEIMRLIVVGVEIGNSGDLSDSQGPSVAETLESWIAQRRSSGAMPRWLVVTDGR